MPPTRVRYSMLGLLGLLAMITYMDRAMYGSAKSDLMKAIDRPVSDFFWILTAFQVAYALFEIPTGWMGDRFGPRFTLLRVVLWWSFFVAVTGCAGMTLPGTEFVLIGFGALIVTEFLFGAGEAGAFPNISKALYNWFPDTHRGFAKGTIWMCARFMGGMTPLIWVLLTSIAGLTWRQTLWSFAFVAVGWCVLFAIWFRNRPDEHPSVNEAERALIQAGRAAPAPYSATPWGKIFTSRNMIAMCLMYTVTNFNWYFLMYYLPDTLKSQFPEWRTTQAGEMKLALLGGGPLLVGMFGCLLGGALSDRLIRATGSRKWGRRAVPMFAYAAAGTCYLSATQFLGDLIPFATCLILMGFFNDLALGPAWATTQDVGRRNAAVVGGAMNMIGNLGAMLGIQFTGRVLKAYTDEATQAIDPAGYIVCFITYSCIYFGGIFIWLFIDASRPIDPDSEPRP